MEQANTKMDEHLEGKVKEAEEEEEEAENKEGEGETEEAQTEAEATDLGSMTLEGFWNKRKAKEDSSSEKKGIGDRVKLKERIEKRSVEGTAKERAGAQEEVP